MQPGESFTAYEDAIVPNGSTCQQETRTCTNGVVTGNYAEATCTVAPAYAGMTLRPMVAGFAANSVSAVAGGIRVLIANTGGNSNGDWAANDLAVSTACKSSGKWYWEVTTTNVGGSAYVGIATNPAAAWPPVGMYSQGGTSVNNSGPYTSTNFWYVTRTLGFKLDMDSRTLATTVNGVPQEPLPILADGCYYIAMGTSSFYGPLDVIVNTGQGPFVSALPAGYSPFTE